MHRQPHIQRLESSLLQGCRGSLQIIKLLSHLRGSLLHCFPEEGGSLSPRAIGGIHFPCLNTVICAMQLWSASVSWERSGREGRL